MVLQRTLAWANIYGIGGYFVTEWIIQVMVVNESEFRGQTHGVGST